MPHGLPPLPPRPAVALQVADSPPTYVVQAPKDQIFRVPPPENARLVEYYRGALEKRRRTPACFSWLAKALAVLLLVLIVCLVAVLVFYLVVGPKDPIFSVRDIARPVHREEPRFDIRLSVENPSAKMGYFFDKGGEASLSNINGEDIASGEPPAFNLGYGNGSSEDFKLLLVSVEESLKGWSKDVVSLQLSVNFLVRPTVGGIKWWLEHMNVVCNVRASYGPAKGTINVVSEKCETKVLITN